MSVSWTPYLGPGGRETTTWRVTFGTIEVWVSRGNLDHPNQWVAGVTLLLNAPRQLSGIKRDDVEGAQRAALLMAAEVLRPYVEAYEAIRAEVGE